MFNTTKFYFKIHQITGHRYLGKTIRCPIKNGGGGVRFKRHAKKYGDLWDTYEIAEFPSDQKEKIRRFGLYLSAKHDIVDLDKWLNLIPENGLDGGDVRSGENHPKPWLGKKFSKEHKQKIAKAMINRGHDYIVTSPQNVSYLVTSPQQWAKKYFPDKWKYIATAIMDTAAGRKKSFYSGWKAEIA